MHTRKLVANRRDEGQNWKFCSDITGRVACPIDLRIAETKSVLQKIPRDRRDVALPPAPVIDVRLINENQPRRHRENADYKYDLRALGNREKLQQKLSRMEAGIGFAAIRLSPRSRGEDCLPRRSAA